MRFRTSWQPTLNLKIHDHSTVTKLGMPHVEIVNRR